MSTQIVGGGTTTLDALSVAGAADFGTPTYAGVAMGRMVLGTAQATTSGTSIDFTGIPSWVKRFTAFFNVVSTSGTSDIVLRVGAGTFLSTGYAGSVGLIRSGGTSNSYAFSTAVIAASEITATDTYSGSVSFTNIGSNTWVVSGSIGTAAASRSNSSNGSIPVGGTLDRLRFTTANGTDTFDAGSVNILYEG